MSFTENLKVEIESIFDATGFKKLRASLRRANADIATARTNLQSLGNLDPMTNVSMGQGQTFSGMPGFDISQARNIRKTTTRMERMRNTVSSLNLNLDNMNPLVGSNSAKFQSLGDNTSSTASATKLFKNKASSAASMLSGDMIPSLQSLQMTLLGVQFQLLSLAFIFGGLMGSALGAVGIFEILGNTLKMFFLPIALELLPAVLNIREAILGVDDETKKMIGRVFAAIAGFAAFGSILAFVTNGFLSVLTVVKGLASPFLGLISLLLKSKTGASSLLGALSAFGSGGVLGGLASIATTIASYIPHIAAVIAIATALFTIFNRFPGLTKTIASTVMKIFGPVIGFVKLLFKNMTSIISGLLNIITGVVTVVAGLLTGQFGKAKKGLKEIFFGISQFMIQPFINFINFLIKHILPAIGDFAFMIPKLIVKALMGIGGLIKDALKSVLPDFIWNRVKGLFSGAGAVGDLALSALNAPKRLLNSIDTISGPQIGKDFKPDKNKKGQTKVQQNNINANVEVNDKEETPQETGRSFGKGLAQGLNSRQSNFSGGT